MTTIIDRKDWIQFLLATLIFVLAYTNGHANSSSTFYSLTPYDSAPKEVIYLAQSSSNDDATTDEEDPEKKLLLEEEEEEEEPDCE